MLVEGLILTTSWEICEVVIEEGQEMLDIGKFKTRMEERVEKYIILGLHPATDGGRMAG